jgi:hypothetical protein
MPVVTTAFNPGMLQTTVYSAAIRPSALSTLARDRQSMGPAAAPVAAAPAPVRYTYQQAQADAGGIPLPAIIAAAAVVAGAIGFVVVKKLRKKR